jgi:hypothetical protein
MSQGLRVLVSDRVSGAKSHKGEILTVDLRRQSEFEAGWRHGVLGRLSDCRPRGGLYASPSSNSGWPNSIHPGTTADIVDFEPVCQPLFLRLTNAVGTDEEKW